MPPQLAQTLSLTNQLTPEDRETIVRFIQGERGMRWNLDRFEVRRRRSRIEKGGHVQALSLSMNGGYGVHLQWVTGLETLLLSIDIGVGVQCTWRCQGWRCVHVSRSNCSVVVVV